MTTIHHCGRSSPEPLGGQPVGAAPAAPDGPVASAVAETAASAAESNPRGIPRRLPSAFQCLRRECGLALLAGAANCVFVRIPRHRSTVFERPWWVDIQAVRCAARQTPGADNSAGSPEALQRLIPQRSRTTIHAGMECARELVNGPPTGAGKLLTSRCTVRRHRSISIMLKSTPIASRRENGPMGLSFRHMAVVDCA